MKKLGLFFGMAAFLAAGMLFWGCDKMGRDDFMPPGQEKKLASEFEFVMSENGDNGGGDCEVDCINPSGPFFKIYGQKTDKWGGPTKDKNSKTVSYEAYNTSTHFVVAVTFSSWADDEAKDADFIKVTCNDLGDPITIAPFISGETKLFNFPLLDDFEPCQEVTFTIQQQGVNTAIYFTDVTYQLYTVCQGCEDSMDAKLVCDDDGIKTLTITFWADEAGPIVIQGGLTAKTTIINSVSNLLTLNKDHSSAGGPSNVTRWEGDVEACQVVTVTIEFSGGNGVGDWSAKRGDDTLGETEAITCNED